MPSEREVLFFPFSSFEVKEIKDIKIGYETEYEIKLLYLGKYLKDFENDKNLVKKEIKIPDSEFTKSLSESGLIEKESIVNLNSKILYDKFIKYDNEIKANPINDNFIIGEIYVDHENKEIQIINSIENYWRELCGSIQDNGNEKEIKENCIIKIEGKKIDFSYKYKFKKEGKFKIEYIFKNKLTNTSYMFGNCKSLKFKFIKF